MNDNCHLVTVVQSKHQRRAPSTGRCHRKSKVGCQHPGGGVPNGGSVPALVPQGGGQGGRGKGEPGRARPRPPNIQAIIPPGNPSQSPSWPGQRRAGGDRAAV